MNEQVDTQEPQDDVLLTLDPNSEDANSAALEDDAALAAQSGLPAGEDDGAGGEGQSEEELVLQFGEEAPPASTNEEQNNAPQWVKDLRKSHAAAQRRIRELEAKERTQQQPQPPQAPMLGPKPKLEQFDYDEGKFDEALSKWYDTKRQVDAAQDEQRVANEARQRSQDERLRAYAKEAAELRVKDFQEAESEVVSMLSVEQQGILLAGATKPAALVCALGRHPIKLQQLAQIKDPVRFAFAAAHLEKELKIMSRTATKPAPEGRISSSAGAPAAGGGERKLEQLRAEAEKTGDYSKVVAYKRRMKQTA